MTNKFYVYEWYNLDNNEVFYVGKGTGRRYKNISDRNVLFKEYYNTHKCTSRIIKYFDNEKDAFDFEATLIDFYQTRGEAKCCIATGGYGGFSITWGPKERAYWSKNNPMKSPEQRQRMRINNPMNNPQIVQKVSATHKRSVIINYQQFDGIIDAAKYFNVATNTVLNWCKRGYDTNGNPCHYANEPQKEYCQKTTCSKAVLLDGIYFPSVRAACDSIHVKDTSPMVRALKQHKKYKGHICEYANQQPSQKNSDEISILEGSTTNG